MARTALTVQTLDPSSATGLTPAPTAGQADGHYFANAASNARYGTHFALVTNNGVASRDITFQTGATVEGIDIEEVTYAIPAGATRIIGPFTPRVFNRPAGGADPDTVYVDYDAGNEADLDIEIFEMPVS